MGCDVSLQRPQTISQVALGLGWLCRVVPYWQEGAKPLYSCLEAVFGLPQEEEVTLRKMVLSEPRASPQGIQLRAISLQHFQLLGE